MRALWVALGWVALGCAGPASLRAPFDDVGVPGPPWDQGEPEYSSSGREASVEIVYKPFPGSSEEAVAAFKAASVAQGWTESEGKRRTDRANLRKPGARLSISTTPGTVRLRREARRTVEESWPRDPFCPEEARLDPLNQSPQVRVCYLVGTEMSEHGPYESVEERLIERGQHENGLRVGRWTAVVTDVDGIVYDRLTEYSPEKTVQTWHRKDTGQLVLTEELQGQTQYLERQGALRWEDGPTITFDKDRPEPSFARSAACDDNPLRVDIEDEIEILDVETQARLVAFRHIVLPNPDEGSHPCAYPGMEDPRSGVDLGLLDVDKGEVTRWTVYKAASRPEECTPEAESKRALAEAKARLTELGLDVTREPKPLEVEIEKDKDVTRYRVQMDEREVILAVEKLYEAPISEPTRYALLPSPEMYTVVGLWEGVRQPPLFESYDPMNNLRPSLSLFGAWEEGGHALVAWRNDAIPSCAVWGFVPVQ